MPCTDYPGTSCQTTPDGIGENQQGCVLTKTSSAEDTLARCTDNQDNDGDTYVDCDDSSCCTVVDCSQKTGLFCAQHETSYWTCKDGKDNDGDTYVDCDDANCCPFVDCSNQPSTYCGMNP